MPADSMLVRIIFTVQSVAINWEKGADLSGAAQSELRNLNVCFTHYVTILLREVSPPGFAGKEAVSKRFARCQ